LVGRRYVTNVPIDGAGGDGIQSLMQGLVT